MSVIELASLQTYKHISLRVSTSLRLIVDLDVAAIGGSGGKEKLTYKFDIFLFFGYLITS
jgi:hypothetical protein